MMRNTLINKNILSLLSSGSAAVLGFFTILFLARTYPKSVFGDWEIFFVAIQLLEILRFGVIGIGLTHYLSSTEDDLEKKRLIGSSWVIGIIITAFAALIFFPIAVFCGNLLAEKGFALFFTWFPFYFISVLPFCYAHAILQSNLRYGRILFLTTLQSLSFMVFVILNFFLLRLGIDYVALAFIISVGLSSVAAMFAGWSGIGCIADCKRATIRKLLGYGKFSLGTSLSANLLKSMDTILIGIFMTTTEVALYAIPLRLIKVLEIPLNGLSEVALPLISQNRRLEKRAAARDIFYKYAGAVSLLFIPLLILLFLFAEKLVWIVGGDQYIETGTSTLIFRIFVLYAVFLTLERFTGTALDGITKPKRNFLKVTIMTVINAVGDVAALLFLKSLEAVAVVTLLTVISGVYLGLLFLKKEMDLRVPDIFKTGFKFLAGKSRLALGKSRYK